MLDLSSLDLEEIAAALADQTDYEHRWLINPERNMAAVAGSVGLIAILVGVALLIATMGVYFLGRNRMRASSGGFSSIPGQRNAAQ